MTTEDTTSGQRSRERVELCFPGFVDFVALARFAAATVAARAGFDVDDLEDLCLAVDELCITLGPLQGDSGVRLAFDRAGDTLDIVAQLDAFGGSEGADQSAARAAWEQGRELSAMLLDSLVDEHGVEIRDGQPSAWLRKRPSNARR